MANNGTRFFDRPWQTVAWRTGAILAIARLVAGLVFILLMWISTESAIAIGLVDLPTTLLIVVLDHFHLIERVDPTDAKYFVLGSAAWFCTGWIIGAVIGKVANPRIA